MFRKHRISNLILNTLQKQEHTILLFLQQKLKEKIVQK